MSSILSEYPETTAPTESETRLAQESSRRLSKYLGSDRSAPVRVQIEAGGESEEISIPASVFRLLNDILTQMALGNAVVLIPVHAELSTQQAADLLNVSRPFLIEQLEKECIPYRKVGTHRRVLFQDLMEYKQSMDQNRRQALKELSAIDQELGFDA